MAIVSPLHLHPLPPIPRARNKSAAVVSTSSVSNNLKTTAVRGINLILSLSLVYVSCFIEFSQSHTSGSWVREGHFSQSSPSQDQKCWVLIPKGTFQYEVESFLFFFSGTKFLRGVLTFLKSYKELNYHPAFPTGKQTWIIWQTPASGCQQLGYLEEGAGWRALLHLKLTTLIYPSFHREQQAIFRDLSNSCVFQTKMLFRKMIQMWVMCFSRIWRDFPIQMALCVLLKDGALTSHVANAWWMTWCSQFTFGWWSELNCQNAWVSDGQCLACSDLFLMKWVDPGAFAPSRFDKLNKAGLLERLTSVSSQDSRIQCPDSVASIINFIYVQHLYLLLGLPWHLPICCQVWSCPRLGH